jgi:hypothetical protein
MWRDRIIVATGRRSDFDLHDVRLTDAKPKASGNMEESPKSTSLVVGRMSEALSAESMALVWRHTADNASLIRPANSLC